MHLIPAVIGAAAMLAQAGVAFGEATVVRPDQAEFRALYEELVETNTTLSEGSCTEAAAKMGARLQSAGFADADLTYFADPAHPREGGLVAVLKGTDPRARPILMIAHLDVVEARREDWTRDPFTLVEEGGFFYARGAFDDKAQAAIWTDSFIRIKRGDDRPKRTLKLALTCGEESVQAFNGVEWLVENRPELIAAEFALNEGGTGRLGADGRRESLVIQVSEKATQNYPIEATHPGGHSSRPVVDNAIYELAAALERIRDHRFPVLLNETTRIFLAAYAGQTGGAKGEAIVRLLANPGDAQADRIRVRGSRSQSGVADHARGHASGRWPRQQCPAPAGRRQPELPDHARGNARRDRGRAGGCDRRPDDPPDHCAPDPAPGPASAARSPDPRPRAEAGGPLFPGNECTCGGITCTTS